MQQGFHKFESTSKHKDTRLSSRKKLRLQSMHAEPKPQFMSPLFLSFCLCRCQKRFRNSFLFLCISENGTDPLSFCPKQKSSRIFIASPPVLFFSLKPFPCFSLCPRISQPSPTRSRASSLSSLCFRTLTTSKRDRERERRRERPLVERGRRKDENKSEQILWGSKTA